MREQQEHQKADAACEVATRHADLTCAEAMAQLDSSLDAERSGTTQPALQVHLARCEHCRDSAQRVLALEQRIVACLRTPVDARTEEVLWARALERAVAAPGVASRGLRLRWLYRPSVHAQWISLVASLVFLAALASAGLGLRHGHDYVAPENRPGQRAMPIVQADPTREQLPGRHAGSAMTAYGRAS